MAVSDKITEAFQNSDVAGSNRVGQARDGLQSGDVDGSLGARETSVLRAQENEAAEQGNLSDLAWERLGDPTATMDDGQATATSSNSLGSSVVDVDAQDVGEAGREVQASEGGDFADGTTVRSSEGFRQKARRYAHLPRIMFNGKTFDNPAFESGSGGSSSDPAASEPNSSSTAATQPPQSGGSSGGVGLVAAAVAAVVAVVAAVVGGEM